MTFFRKPKAPITQRQIAAINNFHSLAYSGESVDIPAKRAPSRDLEHKEAVALMKWWRINYSRLGAKEIALFAIPNGGARDNITGSKLKQEGVTPGVFDYMLAIPMNKYHGMFLELKAEGGRMSLEQRGFGLYVSGQGYYQTAQWGWQNAAKEILKYLGQEHLWRGA